VSLLSYTKKANGGHAALIKILFNFNWRAYPAETIRAYAMLLTNLVCANGAFLERVIGSLVETFLYVPKKEDKTGLVKKSKKETEVDEIVRMELEPSYQFDSDDFCREAIHATIKRICSMIPAAATCLLPILEEKYPFFKQCPESHFLFLKNMLRISTYVPSLRDRIVRLAVSKIAEIDVMVTQGMWERHLPQPQDESKMDCDSESDSKSGDEDFSQTEEVIRVEGCMKIVIEYLQVVAKELEGREDFQSQEVMHALFGSLLRAFETVIIRTKGSRAVQFILLFFCQYDHLYYETVLKRLVERILEPTESVVVRKSCVDYIASFLVSASYVRHATLLHLWKLLLAWVHEYVQLFEEQISSMGFVGLVADYLDPSQHQVFYSICNAVLYLFVARFDQLHVLLEHLETEETVMTSDEKLEMMFGRMFSHSLLAVQYCKPFLVIPFVKLCADYGWSVEGADRFAEENEEAVAEQFKGFLHFKMPFGRFPLRNSTSFFENICRGLNAEEPEFEEEKEKWH
jgi:RNA polymerase I-specific transcription initiation factor RRN3